MRGQPADLKTLMHVGALGGIAAIAAERQRHATAYPLDYGRIKGYSAEHDDQHTGNELALAGAAYAIPCSDSMTYLEARLGIWPVAWGNAPMHVGTIGPDLRKRELEKAGALIAAEWDRIDRFERRRAQQDGTTPPPVATPETSGLQPTPEPVTSVTLRIDLANGDNSFIGWEVRRLLLGYLTRLEDARAGSHDAETFDGKALGLLHPLPTGTLTVTCNEHPEQFARQYADLSRLRPIAEWHDDDGPVLWWALRKGKIEEPPAHVGTPTDSDWPEEAYQAPEYAWYWTPLIEPSPIV